MKTRTRPMSLGKLVRLRPYTARQRIREVMIQCEGSPTRMARVFGIRRQRMSEILAVVGLREEAREIRAARARANHEAHQLAWSLYGRMWNKTEAGKANQRERNRRRPKPVR